MDPQPVSPTCGSGSHWVAARRIRQEYNIFTVVERASHPAESGKLAARYILVEIAEACRREAAQSGSYPEVLLRWFGFLAEGFLYGS